ncbi:MAG: XRE family transcriptional regulator [Actinobacteria bacterium]|nr:MAG: XRE family transcriptional regulator [Actinomycetota bacterium]RIK06316.1 MAG: hypothetical protein DCC48_07780 [Acidobacteriota bacterium]
MLLSMARRKQTRPSYTVNQVIASNVAKARLLRGWTQQEAAEALAPYLGTKMSPASFSAIERSVDGGRVREFDADEVFAFARGFGLPIGWFFTPPSPNDNIGLATPDAPADGLDPHVLLDALLGTNETVDAWRQLLLSWPLMTHRMRLHDDGSADYLGRDEDDVHPRLDILRQLQAGMSVRDALGDIAEARHVLLQLADLLAELGDHATDDSTSTTPARSKSKAPKK